MLSKNASNQSGGWWSVEKNRAWLYRIAGPVEALAIAYGAITERQGALWLALAAAVLTGGTAVANTSTKA